MTHLEGGADAASAFLSELLPGAVPVADEGVASGNLIVVTMPQSCARLSELFAKMEARPEEAMIVHRSLRQPSLEEVFLRISRMAEAEQHGAAATPRQGESERVSASEEGDQVPPRQVDL